MKRLLARRSRKLNIDYYAERWCELQKYCASRKTWPQSIMEADALLDEALKQCRFKGKTVGERLVAAQRQLSDNEAVWFGHKYCQNIPDIDVRKLRKQDVLQSLHGFRQALRDIGALAPAEAIKPPAKPAAKTKKGAKK